uniref:alpha-1-antiproteinase-like n=1 Tax=Jaculus jaculus TaxID=51337 RepID=UPI001E1B2700|nr:alpha-1-antiproteinase-like [Jaculus jaculus]
MSISITDFAFDLYHHFCSWSQTSNILFSPVSIATAFTMLSLGTKGNTHKQILEGLKFNLTKMPEDLIHECFHHFLNSFHQPQITTGSSFFLDQSLKLVQQFKEEIEKMYYSDIMLINFTDNMAARQINNYLEQKTHGEIVEAMKDLEKDTAFVLMNYIAFYGKWQSEFSVEHTVEEDFYVDSDTTVKVPMSHCRGQFFLYRELELDSWVMVHHYVGDTTGFFFLPDLGKMRHLETSLNHRHFENILRNMALRSADVYFPKLSISETYDLKTMLTQMGITQVFSNEADLSGVTEDAPLKLSKSIHKAMLTFDNEEMEASEEINLDAMTRTLPPSLSWTLFLLPGLCCLLPSSQAEDILQEGASDYGNYQEPSHCQKVALTIASFSFSLL